MSDLALIWDEELGAFDLALDGAELAIDEGLRTSVILSCFQDRRAEPDDLLPDDTGDRRGWWGDALTPIEGDQEGSRLWLLDRAKQLDVVVQDAGIFAAESLAWMTEDGAADAVEVTAEVVRDDVLGLQVVITRPDAPPARFVLPWEKT